MVDWDGFGRLGMVKIGKDLGWECVGLVVKREGWLGWFRMVRKLKVVKRAGCDGLWLIGMV